MIKVDISNIWGELSLPELLAAEKEVFDAHMKLSEGNGEGGDFLGWMDLPIAEETTQIRWIRSAAARIRENSDIFVVVGIGGYKFRDYAKAGLPLILCSFIICMVLLPILFPFYP